MRVLTLIGTRPEAIKMAPVIKVIEARSDFVSVIGATGQHHELLYPTLSVFGIKPQIDLQAMEPGQNLNQLFAKLLRDIDGIISEFRPDWLLVQGDTSTAAAGALAAFQRRVPIAHVEAGLRSGDMTQPWPEEMNRRLVDMLADLLFAPTERARVALEAEGIASAKVHVTGNTVVDALLMIAATIDADPNLRRRLRRQYARYLRFRNVVLVTGHRRENFGEGMVNICRAIAQIVQDAETCVLYPVHMNPNVRQPVNDLLSDTPNVFLIEPVDYIDFVFLMRQATVILTDSGGIQEEAPTFGTPVLVMRNVTERPEAIEAGIAKLVGTEPDTIVSAVRAAIQARLPRRTGSVIRCNPFGDGRAAERIVALIARSALGSGDADRIVAPSSREA